MAIIQRTTKKTDETLEPKTPKADAPKTPSHLTPEEEAAIAAIIRRPWVTEKASGLAVKNAYVFSVAASATKPQVASAIEKRYRVNVVQVRTVTIPRKRRMRGRLEGWKVGVHKAIVTIKQGQTIELA